MLHTYSIAGMHCTSCPEKVQRALATLPEIESVDIDAAGSQARISMNRHVSVEVLNKTLSAVGEYTLAEAKPSQSATPSIPFPIGSEPITIRTYYPLLLVFLFLVGIVTIATIRSAPFSGVLWMSNFMSGFFLTFSFFKLLDLKGFAASYSSYDIITKHWFTFGFIYPFIELALGIGYLLVPMSLVLNYATVVIMGVSSIGVIESVSKKRKIKCACLGTVFNLPMGTITITEDFLMIVMSLLMIAIEAIG